MVESIILFFNTNKQTTSATTSTQANEKPKNNATATTATAKSKEENKFSGAMTQQTSEEVFLQTAIVSVNFRGETILLRAVLHPASQNNLITGGSTTLTIEEEKQQNVF